QRAPGRAPDGRRRAPREEPGRAQLGRGDHRRPDDAVPAARRGALYPRPERVRRVSPDGDAVEEVREAAAGGLPARLRAPRPRVPERPTCLPACPNPGLALPPGPVLSEPRLSRLTAPGGALWFRIPVLPVGFRQEQTRER